MKVHLTAVPAVCVASVLRDGMYQVTTTTINCYNTYGTAPNHNFYVEAITTIWPKHWHLHIHGANLTWNAALEIRWRTITAVVFQLFLQVTIILNIPTNINTEMSSWHGHAIASLVATTRMDIYYHLTMTMPNTILMDIRQALVYPSDVCAPSH